ncbi:MAG TPA: RNA polymerase sigma factor [Herpetosiphonaceae bacterium]
MSHPLALSLADGRGASQSITLDELYRQYRGPLLRYLGRLCGSPEAAEDLLQETFVRVCGAVLSFRGECSVATWLFRIARNAYLNGQRRPAHARIPTEELLAIPDHHGDGDPVLYVTAREAQDRIALALAGLPEKQRSILLLRDGEDLAYAEIAEVLEISLSAVKVNLFRARAAFRAAYARIIEGEQSDDQL